MAGKNQIDFQNLVDVPLSSVSSSTTTSVQRFECRICYDTIETTELICPCNCKESRVHRNCLNTWRVTSENDRNCDRCEICHFEYEIESASDTTTTNITNIIASSFSCCYFIYLISWWLISEIALITFCILYLLSLVVTQASGSFGVELPTFGIRTDFIYLDLISFVWACIVVGIGIHIYGCIKLVTRQRRLFLEQYVDQLQPLPCALLWYFFHIGIGLLIGFLYGLGYIGARFRFCFRSRFRRQIIDGSHRRTLTQVKDQSWRHFQDTI